MQTLITENIIYRQKYRMLVLTNIVNSLIFINKICKHFLLNTTKFLKDMFTERRKACEKQHLLI